MSDDNDLEEAIVEMAKEDWCGLYEVIWHMNKVQPAVPEKTKIEAARPVIDSLLQRGEILLGWMEWPKGGPPTYVPAPEATQLLADPKSWEPGERYLAVWSAT